MKARIGFLVLAGLLLVGCRRREEKPAAPAGGMPAGHGSMASRKPSVVQVPDAIKERWKAGRFSVLDTSTKKTATFTAKLGQDTPVPRHWPEPQAGGPASGLHHGGWSHHQQE